MRRAFSILFSLLIILSSFGFTMIFDITTENAGGTPVGGTYTTNQNWNFAGSPYHVTSTVTIDSGAVVTIAPGVEVLFNNTYSLIINDGAISAIGTKSQPIRFNKTTSAGNDWSAVEVRQSGFAEFDWCSFGNVTSAIKLINNEYKTTIANSTFDSTCNEYFNLDLGSKVNVTSSKFANQGFENDSVITNNLNNKITINDANSELYIQYFVNVNTVNGYVNPLMDINVDVSDTRNTRIGRTDTNGQFWYNPVTACKISGTTPGALFSYLGTIVVSDKWAGAGPPFEETGISINQTTPPINSSSRLKDNDLYISLTFMFKYPPKIDTTFSSSVKVSEDTNTSITFSIHDNDDLEFNYGFNNLTINITDQFGGGIYGSNAQDKWISWSNTSGGQLHFYRTIESPFSPAPPDDFDAVVNEQIYITIIDPFGHKDTIGPVTVEFTNVPDKPVLTGLPSATEVTYVTEDVEKNIPITVSDNDNSSADITVYSSSPYITYEYNGPSLQNLKLLFPNEFGEDEKQELVYINATDGCSDEVVYSFLVEFTQTPDPPQILGVIPDKWGDEDAWESDMSLGEYAFDPDPDDSTTTLKWYVSGLDTKVYGQDLFTVSNEGATADAPLSFNLNPEIDLGGARDIPKTYEDDITIILKDKDANQTSQDITLHINATNTPPSLHKLDYQGSKATVIPQVGLTSDSYTFQIEYRDIDGEFGDEPDYVRVYLDGKPHDMEELNTADSDYSDGKTYVYTASMLTAGIHEHYFECSDTDQTTRLPLPDAVPVNISGPEVSARMYILRKVSIDGNFIVRLAHTSMNAFADVVDANQPMVAHEPDKDERNKTKGDIGKYFQVDTLRIESLAWVEITVNFGTGYSNYNTTWLRKVDMQLAYFSPVANDWTSLFSNMDTRKQSLKVNFTGQEELLSDMISTNNKPIFTVLGVLDADNDGYFNARDGFPFDPAASVDTDVDNSPDKWNPGKSAKDTTTGLYLDAFKYDPSASKDADNDKCPDEWNPGKNQNDSNSDPKLTLDRFPGNPGACEDSDRDGMPDILMLDKNNQPELIEDTDDDNDGMPDSWEDEWMRYAEDNDLTPVFNPKDPNDAKLDFDDDGLKNSEEYKEGKNPYKKDADDDGIMGDSMLLILAIVIIIIVLILIFAFVLRKRGKKDEEVLEGKAEAPIEGGPEAGEGELPPDARVDESMGTDTEHYLEPEGGVLAPEPESLLEAEAPTPPMESDAGDEMTAGVGLEESEPTGGEEVVTSGEETAIPPDTETTEIVSEPGAAPATEGEVTETTAPPAETAAIEFTCPNCGTGLTREMTECPGCAAPLVFD
jgi:hypothetical protein